ncbi:MAG: 3-phosphoshikimate 1-carboxyvinyltransferase [Pseudomonadota bacterium]|nr:3-phosphoshikimate 1-carboxyvinyltransferase [Pseudomonadota bacterium]
MKSISSKRLKGNILIPGDKSISHRVVILSSIAIGISNIKGLLLSDDVKKTIESMTSFGASIKFSSRGICTIEGVGLGGILEPKVPLNFDNSGTSARLVMGLASTHNITSIFTGDASLSSRPMKRVLKPLTNFGANYSLRKDNFLPAILKGSDLPIPFTYELKEPSAQIKSAILLGALNTPGTTKVIDKYNTRDHTERLLDLYDADIEVRKIRSIKEISINGVNDLKALNIDIPGDPSSAIFPIVASLICKGSDITVKNILINPTRDGAFRVLKNMGAKLKFMNHKRLAGEDVYDINAKYSDLKGVDIKKHISPTMIDDYPIIAIAASKAKGKTTMRGLSELKLKESNRFEGIINLLRKSGVKVEQKNNDIIIYGNNELKSGGFEFQTYLDHRMAMSALIMGLISKKEIEIDNSDTINTSFPTFYSVMLKINSKISRA